tara:strand:- start:362 stop:541 length:180 start_codon:yes stop_codon:yes gene_type:complete
MNWNFWKYLITTDYSDMDDDSIMTLYLNLKRNAVESEDIKMLNEFREELEQRGLSNNEV